METSVAGVGASVPPGAVCGAHPETAASTTCTRCGSFSCVECAKPDLDDEVLCEVCFARIEGLTPWERGRDIGWWRAFWGTTHLMCVSPGATFVAAPREIDLAKAFTYASAAVAAGYAGVGIWYCVGVEVIGVAQMLSGDTRRGVLSLVAGPIALILFAVLGVVVGPFVVAGQILTGGPLNHLGFVLLRARNASLAATMRATAYGMGPMALMVIPVFGLVVAPIWSMIATLLALRRAHRTTMVRALVAFVSVNLLVTLVFGLLGFLLGFLRHAR